MRALAQLVAAVVFRDQARHGHGTARPVQPNEGPHDGALRETHDKASRHCESDICLLQGGSAAPSADADQVSASPALF